MTRKILVADLTGSGRRSCSHLRASLSQLILGCLGQFPRNLQILSNSSTIRDRPINPVLSASKLLNVSDVGFETIPISHQGTYIHPHLTWKSISDNIHVRSSDYSRFIGHIPFRVPHMLSYLTRRQCLDRILATEILIYVFLYGAAQALHIVAIGLGEIQGDFAFPTSLLVIAFNLRHRCLPGGPTGTHTCDNCRASANYSAPETEPILSVSNTHCSSRELAIDAEDDDCSDRCEQYHRRQQSSVPFHDETLPGLFPVVERLQA